MDATLGVFGKDA